MVLVQLIIQELITLQYLNLLVMLYILLMCLLILILLLEINNGLILQFGCINVEGNRILGWITINFPLSFSNTNYFLEVTEVNSSYRSINLDGTHKSYFRLENISTGGCKNRWIAVGF